MNPTSDDVVERLNQTGGPLPGRIAFWSLLAFAGFLFLLIAARSWLLAMWLLLLGTIAAFVTRSLLRPLDQRRQWVRLAYPPDTDASPIVNALTQALTTLVGTRLLWIERRVADLVQLGANPPQVCHCEGPQPRSNLWLQGWDCFVGPPPSSQ